MSKKQAKHLLENIKRRLSECKLELNLEKTKLVFCKDSNREGDYTYQSFDFLGFTFKPRFAKSRYGKYFVNFSPAVSTKSLKKIRRTIRSWNVTRRSDRSIEDFARMYNPIIRGWINYYGCFYKSAIYKSLGHLDRLLARWASRKYKCLRRSPHKARRWLDISKQSQPHLFAHWRFA